SPGNAGMDVGLQQPKTSQFPWVSHPDAVPVEIWETPPAVRRRRGVSHIPTGCRIQLGFYSFKCDKGGIAFTSAAFEKDAVDKDGEAEKQRLYAKIGQLEVERDWLKKISKQLGLPTDFEP